MKHCTILFTLLFILTGILSAQVPQSMQYQAVIRDGNGNPLLSTPVQFRFSVESNGGAQLFYQETQSTVTNALGGINLVIGAGNATTGNFQSIDWKSGAIQVRVEMDPTGGSNFSPFGTNSMQSVPYALYALKANSLDDDAVIDPGSLGSGGADAGQVLIWNGNEWGPGDDTDQQTLTVNGNQLSISNGNAVTLPSGSGGGDDWGDQTVETNTTLTGDGTLSVPLRIAQQGAVNGDVLKWNGSSWTPEDDNGASYTAGNGISINNNVISNTGDADANATNEIQTLSLNGSTLSLTNGGSVDLPDGNYTQGTGINIAANVISALNTQNLWNANKLQGFNVSTTTPSGGQILKFNPDQLTWIPSTDNGQNYNAGTGISIAGSIISAQNTQELWNANQLRSFNVADVTPLDGQVLKYTSTGGGWLPQNLAQTYWQPNGNEIYFSQNVGIGVTNPESRLHVEGGSIQIEDQTMKKDLSTSIAFSSFLIPQIDDTKALGTSTRRWTAVYASDGTINTSDVREKKNITPIQYGLEEILKLRPVTYEWKSRNDGKTKLGLIAQELETVIPEVVAKPSTEDPAGSDRLGVYYSDLIPVLIKAIQEQEEKIRLLQEEIALLKK
ncbi:MAG TPA: tail fiber domain-containing protein [Saprospiraceae bacterium]|nr:tail fiber domain-containing protein [Saprospiraceae bacterium]